MACFQEVRNERIRKFRGRGFIIGWEPINAIGKPDSEYSLKIRNRIAETGPVRILVGVITMF